MKNFKYRSFLLPLLVVAIVPSLAHANTLSSIAENLVEQFKALTGLLYIISYICGIGFALAGILQFKAHKDNPAQIPLSKPIVYIAVGAALLFLPSILDTAGESIFGGGQTKADSSL